MKSLVFFAVLLAAEPAWETFESKPGQYTVSLPGKATEKTRKLGRATVHTVELSVDDTGFKVECFDTGASDEQMKQEGYKDRWLKNARNQLVKETKGKLVKETNIDVKNHPGRDLEIDLDMGAIRARIFLVNSWSYTLTVQSREAKATRSADADRFLKSFKLQK